MQQLFRKDDRCAASQAQRPRGVSLIHADLQVPARANVRNRLAVIPARERIHQPRDGLIAYLELDRAIPRISIAMSPSKESAYAPSFAPCALSSSSTSA